jgi:hypothetical protein
VTFGHYGVTFEWIFRKFQGNPLRVTFDDVTSSEKAPLWQILRNFPLRMRTLPPLQGHVTFGHFR